MITAEVLVRKGKEEGILSPDDILAAFTGMKLVWSGEDAGWVALTFNLPASPGV